MEISWIAPGNRCAVPTVPVYVPAAAVLGEMDHFVHVHEMIRARFHKGLVASASGDRGISGLIPSPLLRPPGLFAGLSFWGYTCTSNLVLCRSQPQSTPKRESVAHALPDSCPGQTRSGPSGPYVFPKGEIRSDGTDQVTERFTAKE